MALLRNSAKYKCLSVGEYLSPEQLHPHAEATK